MELPSSGALGIRSRELWPRKLALAAGTLRSLHGLLRHKRWKQRRGSDGPAAAGNTDHPDVF